MQILFLHGWTSVPGGKKPTFLKEHGHDVLNPSLPDDDFPESVRIAEVEHNRHHPDVIVGSSRGGAVAMNMDSKHTPLVLLWPSLEELGHRDQSQGEHDHLAFASRRGDPFYRLRRNLSH